MNSWNVAATDTPIYKDNDRIFNLSVVLLSDLENVEVNKNQNIYWLNRSSWFSLKQLRVSSFVLQSICDLFVFVYESWSP